MATHFMNLNAEPFSCMKSGKKDVEMRLYDEKRAIFKVGDVIEFTNKVTGESLNAEIVALNRFKSFDELYEFYEKCRLGYGENDVAKAEDMLLFYEKEKVDAFGVVAIEIKLL